MNRTFRNTLLSCAVTTSSFLCGTSATFAQEEAASSDVVTVTGSRGQPRAVSDSPVPIDVIGADELEAVPFTDTNDIIRTLVPSYNLSRQPISDGATFIRPASLRGLPTDKTLVLVNSKRRHRAALVTIGGSGTQGPDIATIPAAALQTVEILRDGAAAQYGSDAIAGVMNFILKDDSEGGTIMAEIGEYYEGDGLQTTVSGSYGFDLFGNGFLTLSAEYSKSDATVRAEQYCESWACVDASDASFLGGGSFDDTLAFYDESAFNAGLSDANIGDGQVVQPWGQPNSEAYRLFFNAGYDLDADTSLYAFGNYSQSESDGSFFYRYPGNGTIEDVRLEDGSLWSPLALFPGGFTPRFFGEVYDVSLAGGIKGIFAGYDYDLSGRFGSNEVQYTLANTINPSLGPDSPTSFRPGDLINEELQFQADFSKELDLGFYAPAFLAFGVSYLDESYEIVEGEEESYTAGDFASSDPYGFCDAGVATAAGAAVIANGSTLNCSDSNDAVYRVVGVGSNGFPGYSPEFSNTYERDSYAAYIDVSADLTEDWLLQGAVRYTDYSDFGDNVSWKLATQYDLTDAVGLRGSVSTAFRAPTPGQQGTTNVSTRLPNGFPVATGLFPAGGAVAQALGAEELEPEISTNITTGITWTDGAWSITFDYYNIAVEDYFQAVSTQDVSTDSTAGAAYDNYLALLGAGVVGAESIGGVNWFTNAFDVTSEGIDLVVTYEIDSSLGSTGLTGSLNLGSLTIDSDPSEFFNAEGIYDFENSVPEWRGVLSAVHNVGAWTLIGRANVYGPYSNANGGSTVSVVQDFDTEILIDAEVSYQLSDAILLSVGARNLFDEYPDPGTIGETCCGRIYRSDSIVDWQGGYYYAKVRADF